MVMDMTATNYSCCPAEVHAAMRRDLATFRASTTLAAIAIDAGETLEYRQCRRCTSTLAMAIDPEPLAPAGVDPCPACGGEMSLRGLPCMDCVATGRRHIIGSCDDCQDPLLVPATVRQGAASAPVLCVPCALRGKAV